MHHQNFHIYGYNVDLWTQPRKKHFIIDKIVNDLKRRDANSARSQSSIHLELESREFMRGLGLQLLTGVAQCSRIASADQLPKGRLSGRLGESQRSSGVNYAYQSRTLSFGASLNLENRPETWIGAAIDDARSTELGRGLTRPSTQIIRGIMLALIFVYGISLTVKGNQKIPSSLNSQLVIFKCKKA